MIVLRANLSRWESTPHMNRFFACFSVVLLSCCAAAAQNFEPASPTATAPATAPSAATSTQSTQIAQFQKIEDSWADAVNRHDQYGLELVLSPLFVDVSATGDVTTRNQQVAQVLSNDDKNAYLAQKVIAVRVLGDIVVANGTYNLRHKVNSSQVDDKGVFTHVFERVHGGWVCINSQRTLLREDAATKQKKQSSATAAEPFHIPFFSKSDKSSEQ
jgi:ketosteroid isomerase-like protein